MLQVEAGRKVLLKRRQAADGAPLGVIAGIPSAFGL
jgi:hypothetical protein